MTIPALYGLVFKRNVLLVPGCLRRYNYGAKNEGPTFTKEFGFHLHYFLHLFVFFCVRGGDFLRGPFAFFALPCIKFPPLIRLRGTFGGGVKSQGVSDGVPGEEVLRLAR